MLNRGSSTLHDDDDGFGLLGVAWQVERYPLVRLAILLLFLVSPLFIVGWRVFQLQTQLAPVYSSEYSQLRQQVEDIPCLDGCIFTADGQILAQDIPGLEVHVHYRWIEEPPDPDWLKQKVLQRLPRADRRKPDRFKSELELLLAERAAMWQQLADATSVSLDVLNKNRDAIQKRVQKMRKAATQRRQLAAQCAIVPRPQAVTWIDQSKNWLVDIITAQPEVKAQEKFVLQEELDYYAVVSDVSPKVRAELKSHPEKYPVLRVVDTTHREYPMGDVAPHLIGFRKPLGMEEWKRRQAAFPEGDPLGYRPEDRVGQMGIEKFYEHHLRGVRGQRQIWLNAQGEVVEEREIRAPRPGNDLEVTLNLAIQARAEKALESAVEPSGVEGQASENEPVTTSTPPVSGCVAVMDVRTGEMIAAASWPTFDLNTYLSGDPALMDALDADKRKPLFSRLHRMQLPPGSVFKAVTATAMLQCGMNGHEPFHCRGYLDVPSKKRCLPFVRYGTNHGDVDLSLALAQSCNVYFYHAAREIGATNLLDWADRFGFGQPTGVDLPGEAPGNLPREPARNSRERRPDHLSVAIGQERLLVTPLQIVRMMAAIANGGEMLTPRIARRTGSAVVLGSEGPNSQPDFLAPPKSTAIAEISSGVLQQIRHGLEQVVAHPQGTGYKTVRLKNVSIAGKSGTAEANGGPNHAWFAGYVPANRPKYAFVVVLERGGSGGKAAGPVAKQVVQALLDEGLLDDAQPDKTDRQLTATDPASVP